MGRRSGRAHDGFRADNAFASIQMAGYTEGSNSPLSFVVFVHGGLVRRAAEERGQRRQQRGSGDARGADIRRVVAIPDDTPLVVAPAGAAFHRVETTPI